MVAKPHKDTELVVQVLLCVVILGNWYGCPEGHHLAASFVFAKGFTNSNGDTISMGLLDSFKMTPEKKAKNVEIRENYRKKMAEINAKREASKHPASVTPDDLITTLKGRGEKILNENLSPDEKILVKLQGDGGQALVLTNRQLYVVKWGFMANQTFGGKCIGYAYNNITALELRKKMIMRYVQVLTPANQSNVRSSVWDKDNNGNNAKASDNIVTYIESADDSLFQEAIKLGRKLMNDAHGVGVSPTSEDSNIAQLEQLANLKDKGIITPEEFEAKKKQLLGL